MNKYDFFKEIDNDGYYFGRLEDDLVDFIDEFSKYKQRGFRKEEMQLRVDKINAKKTLTKIFNTNEFPYHTDGVQYELPPRYIILIRTLEADNYTATTIIDGIKIAENNKDLFFRTSFVIKGNGFRELSNIVETRDDEYLLRYNPVIMSSYLLDKKQEIDSIFKKTKSIKIDWELKNFLIIDNWRMLHSRDAVKESDGKRGLKRVELYYE